MSACPKSSSQCQINRGRFISGYGFFDKHDPLTLGQLAEFTKSDLLNPKQKNIQIAGVRPLDEADNTDISYLTSARHMKSFRQSRALACFIPPSLVEEIGKSDIALLKTAQPHYAYAQTIGLFYPQAQAPRPMFQDKGISAKAMIDPSARIEDDVTIEAGAMIGARVAIGKGTIVSAYAVIGADCQIGRDCFIGSHASLSHCLIGDRVVLHVGVRIGQAGFGYVPMADGAFSVPQIGRVIIQNDCHIGANSTIDRGSTRDTIIGEHSKIDNLVQIGHNVTIGRHCFIIAQVGIAGSAKIDDYAILLGQVGVADSAHIGTGARVAAQTGVLGHLAPGGDYMGYPSRSLKQFLGEDLIIKRLWKDYQNKKKKARKEAGNE